jgi:hypothetical protein
MGNCIGPHQAKPSTGYSGGPINYQPPSIETEVARIKPITSTIDTVDAAMKLLKDNVINYVQLPEKFQGDLQVLDYIVANKRGLLFYCPTKLLGDQDLIKRFIATEPTALAYTNIGLLLDKYFCLECIEIDPTCYIKVPDDLQSDPDIIKAALSKKGYLLKYCPVRTDEVCLLAIASDVTAALHVHWTPGKLHGEFLLNCVKISPDVLVYAVPGGEIFPDKCQKLFDTTLDFNFGVQMTTKTLTLWQKNGVFESYDNCYKMVKHDPFIDLGWVKPHNNDPTIQLLKTRVTGFHKNYRKLVESGDLVFWFV